jgi:hypothetical protein
MPVLARKAPYADTEVAVEKSRSQIDQLLRSFGASGVQWSELWDKDRVELLFGVTHDDGKSTAVKVILPTFTASHRTWDPKAGGNRMVKSPNWRQSYRLTYYFLKAKLESVTYGLRLFEEEFLADTVVLTPGGRQVRVAEILVPAITDGRLDVPALTAGGARARAAAIDAESRVAP